MKRPQLEAQIREEFSRHVAELTTLDAAAGQQVLRLRWREPGRWMNAIEFLAQQCGRSWALFARGDLGEAVYVFGSPGVDGTQILDWIAGLELDYFASKCDASETGRGFTNFDSQAACDLVAEILASEERLEEANDDGLRSVSCAEEWHEWLRDCGEKYLGPDWWEYGNAGLVVHPRCLYHLMAVQMATAQLRERAEPMAVAERQSADKDGTR